MWLTRWVDRGSSSRSPTRWSSEAETIFAHIEKAGSGSMLDGTIACIEDGWFVAEIADAAYQFQIQDRLRRVDPGGGERLRRR